jgi:poly(A) polymerase/tRNA nucleotidyltransferase (CCA-adding enzyme)
LHAARPQPADFIDPCGGLRDIANHTLHLCRPTSLRDDPLRTVRAMRLGATLGFTISPELDTALRAAAPLIEQVASERVRDELLKLLAVPHAAPWLRSMDDVGLLTRIFPELEPARHCEQPIVHFLPVLAHSLETVTCLEWLLAPLSSAPYLPEQNTSPELPAAVQVHPDLPRTLPYYEQFQAHITRIFGGGHVRAALLKLAALLHDNAKPQTKQPKAGGGVSFYGHQSIGADVARATAQRLRLSRQAANYIALVIKEHMRPGQLRTAQYVTPRAIARFFRDTGDAGPDILLHALADHMAARGPAIDVGDWQHHVDWTASMVDAHWGKPPERTQPLINGNDLITELGIAPGKLVGDLLSEVYEAQAAGEISTPAEALDLARHLLAEQTESS